MSARLPTTARLATDGTTGTPAAAYTVVTHGQSPMSQSVMAQSVIFLGLFQSWKMVVVSLDKINVDKNKKTDSFRNRKKNVFLG